MAVALEITWTELDADGLRRAAGRSRNAAAARRMLALALVLGGKSRTEAAQAAGMDRQTVRDWVHRYNEEGQVMRTDPDAGQRHDLSCLRVTVSAGEPGPRKPGGGGSPQPPCESRRRRPQRV